MDSERTGTVVGRFAPSPTGPLHLGSLVAAVGSYLFARANGGRWLVRVEDLDPPRVVQGSEDLILAALDAYRLEWDGEVIRQSDRAQQYETVLSDLRKRGHTFECACSRAEIQRASSAPSSRDDGSGPIYPGTCRNGLPRDREARATRFLAPDTVIAFDDIVVGRIEENVARETGDFVVKRADGLHAYQLAVVVDDLAQGVNQVVRGGDLLSSTARQIAIIQAIGGKVPRYAHLPLVIDAAGEKLSKRTGALPLPSASEQSITESLHRALVILGLSTVTRDTPERMLAEAVATFDPERIPRGNVVASTPGQA